MEDEQSVIEVNADFFGQMIYLTSLNNGMLVEERNIEGWQVKSYKVRLFNVECLSILYFKENVFTNFQTTVMIPSSRPKKEIVQYTRIISNLIGSPSCINVKDRKNKLIYSKWSFLEKEPYGEVILSYQWKNEKEYLILGCALLEKD